jgi:hypothetical protein
VNEIEELLKDRASRGHVRGPDEVLANARARTEALNQRSRNSARALAALVVVASATALVSLASRSQDSPVTLSQTPTTAATVTAPPTVPSPSSGALVREFDFPPTGPVTFPVAGLNTLRALSESLGTPMPEVPATTPLPQMEWHRAQATLLVDSGELVLTWSQPQVNLKLSVLPDRRGVSPSLDENLDRFDRALPTCERGPGLLTASSAVAVDLGGVHACYGERRTQPSEQHNLLIWRTGEHVFILEAGIEISRADLESIAQAERVQLT